MWRYKNNHIKIQFSSHVYSCESYSYYPYILTTSYRYIAIPCHGLGPSVSIERAWSRVFDTQVLLHLRKLHKNTKLILKSLYLFCVSWLFKTSRSFGMSNQHFTSCNEHISTCFLSISSSDLMGLATWFCLGLHSHKTFIHFYIQLC